ncbi:MAG: hypothetical protein IPN53_22260 [Comamonadaceae bacterium]|nr:hypothetical protein [Comamonadaceae bacterium]
MGWLTRSLSEETTWAFAAMGAPTIAALTPSTTERLNEETSDFEFISGSPKDNFRIQRKRTAQRRRTRSHFSSATTKQSAINKRRFVNIPKNSAMLDVQETLIYLHFNYNSRLAPQGLRPGWQSPA